MNILVTGGAGFIGFHVAKRLLSDGHRVTILDNLSNFNSRELKLARLAELGIDTARISPGIPLQGPGDLVFIQQDILDRDGLEQVWQAGPVDSVIHLAAVTGLGPSREQPVFFAENNIQGTVNLLDASRRHGVRHLLFTSSACVHGCHAHAPQREEDDVDRPMSIYAMTKRAAELACYSYAYTYRLPVTVMRIFTAFGPWGRPDSQPMTIARDIIEGKPISICNNGYLIRDFTYVDDIVDGVAIALTNPPIATRCNAAYALYNVGRGKPIPYRTFIQAIETALGKGATIVEDPASPELQGESIESYADTSRLEANLAYSPVWDYEESVPLFVDWFRQHYNKTFRY